MHESLSERRPAITGAQAAGFARELFGLEVASVEDLPGERDRNFLVRDQSGAAFVLKVLHPADDVAVAEFQARALLHIAATDPGVGVPRVVAPLGSPSSVLAQASGLHVRCVTYLSGRTLAEAPSDARLWTGLGRFAARLDRALADFSHPADDHELLWDLKRADRAGELLDAMPAGDLAELVGTTLERFSAQVKPSLTGLRMQVIHNDWNAHNIIVSKANSEVVAGVIDFGDMIRGPLSQELATVAAYQSPDDGDPLAAAAAITAVYAEVTPLSDEEIAIVPELMAVRLALSVLISSWRAALYPDEATYITRSQPIVVANLRRLVGADDGEAFLDRVARLLAAS